MQGNSENRKRMIDRLANVDIQIAKLTIEADGIKATLQAEALAVMENRNCKYVEFFGTSSSVFVCYKEKFEIDNLPALENIFGDVLVDKVKKEESVKITLDGKVKKAVTALYKGEYAEHDLQAVLMQKGLGQKEAKAAVKKLKGEYAKDIKVLRSFGVDTGDGAEEELDVIRESKNFELISKYIDPAAVDLDKLKRAVSVEESLAIGIIFDAEGKTEEKNESEDDRAEAD